VYDERDRDDYDPRDALLHDLDLPCGDERELVVERDRFYGLNGEDSRTPGRRRHLPSRAQQDLDIDQGTVDHLGNEGLVTTVDGVVSRRTAETCSMRTPWSATMRPSQAFYAGVEGGNSRGNAEFGPPSRDMGTVGAAWRSAC
jgi:hypothetical protein